MENKQFELKEDLNKKSDIILNDLPLLYEYPELRNRMDSGGSSQVLGDFLEFSDYLIPGSQIIMKYRHSSQSVPEDFYSGLLSF